MNNRFYSLDIFRGATVALMILVNNPGTWSHIYDPLEHAPWHGCTPTDLVFPFFLFAVGNAMAFVMPKFEQAGNAVFFQKVIRRTLLIFAIGLFLNWSPFFAWSKGELAFKSWHDLRIMGVLQRIAICYFFASIIAYFFKLRGAFVATAVILLLYWWVSYAFGAPGDPYSLQGWFGTDIDKAILGESHMYKGEKLNGVKVAFDPEGLMSTIPAIAQVLMGYLAGHYIREKGKTYEMVSNLFVAGCALLFAGFAWDMVFPMNKKIWSSSYVIYTTGLALVTIGVIIHLVEFKGWSKVWGRFFDVFGKNPLFIFVLSGFLPRLLGLIRIPNGINDKGEAAFLTPFGWFYEYICKPVSSNLNTGSLVYAIAMILMYWFIGWLLDRKKIYIKV
jgi:predicted acyltransferase